MKGPAVRGFEGMGEDWVRVRDAARNETLRPGDDGARSVAARWEQLVQYVCLHLSQELGVDVSQLKPRGKTTRDRVQEAIRRLADDGVLERSVRVPDAVAPIRIEANLRTKRVTTSVEIDAPKDLKRPQAKINWIIRQLREAPGDLRIDVRFASSRQTSSALLDECRENPAALLNADDPKRDPRSFTLARWQSMGTKAGLGPGSFVAETRRQTTDFYRDLVQNLKPPQPTPPKIRESKVDQPTAVDSGQKASESDAHRRHDEDLEDLAEVAGLAEFD